jgi:hypothetical protein
LHPESTYRRNPADEHSFLPLQQHTSFTLFAQLVKQNDKIGDTDLGALAWRMICSRKFTLGHNFQLAGTQAGQVGGFSQSIGSDAATPCASETQSRQKTRIICAFLAGVQSLGRQAVR